LPHKGHKALLKKKFLSPQFHVGKVVVGTDFEIREGKRTMAKGRVTKILHLEVNAARVRAG